VAPALRSIDDEQRPKVARLVVRADKTLHVGLVLGNEENGLIQIPVNLRRGDEGRILQPVLGCAVSHFVDAREIGAFGGTQARFGHGRSVIDGRVSVDCRGVDEALPYSFTQAPFAFEDLTAASTKARPLTPSSMVGKCTPSGGFFPERAALIASATSL
jgi:hypothetical protein